MYYEHEIQFRILLKRILLTKYKFAESTQYLSIESLFHRKPDKNSNCPIDNFVTERTYQNRLGTPFADGQMTTWNRHCLHLFGFAIDAYRHGLQILRLQRRIRKSEFVGAREIGIRVLFFAELILLRSRTRIRRFQTTESRFYVPGIVESERFDIPAEIVYGCYGKRFVGVERHILARRIEIHIFSKSLFNREIYRDNLNRESRRIKWCFKN